MRKLSEIDRDSTSSFTGLRTLQGSFHVTAVVALSVLGAANLCADDSKEIESDTEQNAAVVTETEADLAGTAEATTPPEQIESSDEDAPSLYDKIWSYTKWYDNDENSVIQSFAFTGRFQADYATIPEENWHDLLYRRIRLGGKAKFFHQLTVHGEVELAPESEVAYGRMTDAYVAWTRHKNFEVTVGKQSAAFTMDGQTSSKRLLAIDRSNLANNIWFTEEYVPGVTLTGEPGQWVYQAGAFSSGESDSEFGNVSGGIFGLATLGYNFDEALNAEEALLRLNYIYNAPENSDSFANRPLEQIASLNFTYDAGCWGVRTDLSGALGYENNSDVWGAMVMPYYDITDHFQVVTRYTFVRSIDENGVRFGRYENRVVSGRGDEYNEFYLGLNWYLYGHKLKLQTGVDYAHMADRANDGGAYSGWGWTTALRIYW